jgi:hypothetical protein
MYAIGSPSVAAVHHTCFIIDSLFITAVSICDVQMNRIILDALISDSYAIWRKLWSIALLDNALRLFIFTGDAV